MKKTNPETKVCSHCQTSIPFKAKKCPQCQSDLRSPINKHPILTILAFFFLIPMVSVLLTSPEDTTTPEQTARKNNISLALTKTENRVESMLKSPATAEFASRMVINVTNETKDGFTVSSYVDSENGFGANIRTYFSADFYNPDENTLVMKKLVVDGETVFTDK